jgi:hypothetical protein
MPRRNWQSTFLGLKQLPRELTAFEIEAFFTFTLAERQLIEDRRRPTLKLGLALQIGFLRMSGRLLDAVPMVPPALWRHLGADLRRLRREVHRRYNGMAHKLWLWRELLDQFGEDVEIRKEPRRPRGRPRKVKVSGIGDAGSGASPTHLPKD